MIAEVRNGVTNDIFTEWQLSGPTRIPSAQCENLTPIWFDPSRIEGQVLQYDSEPLGGGMKKLSGEKGIV